jgi:hypothetical protein
MVMVMVMVMVWYGIVCYSATLINYNNFVSKICLYLDN